TSLPICCSTGRIRESVQPEGRIMGPRLLKIWLAVLGALHAVIACAGFFAPYDPAEQDRALPFVPPMKVRFYDSRVGFHFRPFVYELRLRPGSYGEYEEDTARPVALRFFTTASRYRLLGVFPSRIHLFGTIGQRFYLLGSDAYGRDLLSRILFGGQIS